MKNCFRLFTYALLASLIIAYGEIIAQEDTTWYWRKGDDPDTVKRRRAELDSLLELHALWLKGSQKGRRLILPGAVLRDADLFNAKLDGADLTGAHLTGADLTYAEFEGASLAEAHLDSVDLEPAFLRNTSLRNSHLEGANLSYAHLEGANLIGSHLKGAYFRESFMNRVIFEPVSLPRIDGIALAKGLKELHFWHDPSALSLLRDEFSKAGFRQRERDIICALRRHDPYLLETVFFDWTSEFSSNLKRPWYILILIWFLCGIAYYSSMLFGTKSGVNLIAPVYTKNINDKQSLLEHGMNIRSIALVDDSLRKTKTRIHRSNEHIQNYASERIKKIPMWIRLWWWALFFSAMSAFNIGFRDINFGRWLRHTTRKEFDLRPTGWVRVVSGFQAITSVYLIGLWVLSFAGMPFK